MNVLPTSDISTIKVQRLFVQQMSLDILAQKRTPLERFISLIDQYLKVNDIAPQDSIPWLAKAHRFGSENVAELMRK